MHRIFLFVVLCMAGTAVAASTDLSSSPDCDLASGDPIELWPPNHRMVEVNLLGVSGASDPDGAPLAVRVLAITQDEPVDGEGAGNTSPDGTGVGTGVAEVRQERSGTGNGRVYEITFEAENGTGETCVGSVRVAVPHSRNGLAAVDDGQYFDSTAEDGSGRIVCGDGVVGPGEECDDGPGPANPNDGCDDDCRRTTWTATVVSGRGPSGGEPTALPLTPRALARDADGNIYVTEPSRVRRISPRGLVATIAGTGERCPSATESCGDGDLATSARFGSIRRIAIDSWGHLYVSDETRHRVRKIDALTGNVSTVINIDGVACEDPTATPACGDGGTAGAARLDHPRGLAVDDQDRLYIADSGNHRVRRVLPHPSTGAVEQDSTIETVAGNGNWCGGGSCGDGGPATESTMTPTDVAVFVAGSETRLYVADITSGADRVREVIVGGQISAFAGAPDNSGVFTDCVAATDYQLQQPTGVEVDAFGNVFIAQQVSQVIFRVDYATRMICSVAGYGLSLDDGIPACEAVFRASLDLLVDPDSNDLYIAVAGHHKIRRVEADGGVIHACQDPGSENNTIRTVAGNGLSGYLGDGNPADTAAVYRPHGLAVDEDGNTYFGDRTTLRIRRVDSATDVVSTVAGSGGFSSSWDDPDNGGDALAANMYNPYSLAFDSFGNLYFIDANIVSDTVRKVDTEGRIWTVAGIAHSTGFNGDGMPATLALLDDPKDIAFDAHNNLYISESGNDRIRRVNAVDGEIVLGVSTITTVAGGGQNQDYGNPAGVAVNEIRLPAPTGLAIGENGTLYFADRGGAYRVFELPDPHLADVYANNGYRVRAIAGSGVRCERWFDLPPGPACGDFGPALDARLRAPEGLDHDPVSGDLFLSDRGTDRVRRLRRETPGGAWSIEPVAGSSQRLPSGARSFGDGGRAADAGLHTPYDLALDGEGNLLIADTYGGKIRSVELSSGFIHTAAGPVFPAGDRELDHSAVNGALALARFDTDLWLVADPATRRIRSVDPTPSHGRVSTVAGYPSGFTMDGAPARYSRKLANPAGVVYDGVRFVYVAESDLHVIRRIDTGVTPWTIETWAGVEGVPGVLDRPGGLAIDAARSLLYVADSGNHVVLAVSLEDPTNIQTVAGQFGTAGCPVAAGDAAGNAATDLTEPVALAMGQDANDSLYVVDVACHMVRRIDLAALPPRSEPVIGDGTAGDPADGVAGDVLLSAPRGATVDGFGNLHVTSRDSVVTVTSGSDRVAAHTDLAIVIYGAPPNSDLEFETDCLTGISVVSPGDGTEDQLFMLDRCLGFLLRLDRVQGRSTPAKARERGGVPFYEPRPRLKKSDRFLWALLSRIWTD